jgi:hypothetical protein
VSFTHLLAARDHSSCQVCATSEHHATTWRGLLLRFSSSHTLFDEITGVELCTGPGEPVVQKSQCVVAILEALEALLAAARMQATSLERLLVTGSAHTVERRLYAITLTAVAPVSQALANTGLLMITWHCLWSGALTCTPLALGDTSRAVRFGPSLGPLLERWLKLVASFLGAFRARVEEGADSVIMYISVLSLTYLAGDDSRGNGDRKDPERAMKQLLEALEAKAVRVILSAYERLLCADEGSFPLSTLESPMQLKP